MREYHITLLQEKLDSLAEGKEICLFEYGKTFKLFVKTDKVEEDKVLDSDVFLDEIEEQLGSDRFDGEYNQECWDYDDVRNSIIDTTCYCCNDFSKH